MSPLVGAAAGGTSCPLRRETPSACSSPHRGRQRKRPAATEHLFQRREAELCLFGKRLPGHTAARDFLANGLRHLAALLGGKLLVRRLHRHPFRIPPS